MEDYEKIAFDDDSFDSVTDENAVETVESNHRFYTVEDYPNQEFGRGGYTYKLADFEGPLDFLLYLLHLKKVSIKDIFISDITEQFLSHMGEISELDMEKAAEFLNMACNLLEIKAKKMLPADNEENRIEVENMEKSLISELEIKAINELKEELRDKETINRFYKDPNPVVGDYRLIMKDCSLDQLLDAFSKLVAKIDNRPPPEKTREIVKDRFTVSQKMDDIKGLILAKKEIAFTKLFDTDYTKSEIITTFLALLELLKRQFITVKQSENYGEINLSYNEEYDFTQETENEETDDYDGETY